MMTTSKIGSLYNFSSILVLSRWKKLEESTCKAILVARSQFGKLGPKNHLKIFQSILRHQTTFFLVQTYSGGICHILHIDTFPMVQELSQSEFVCESYASFKLTYFVYHHGMSGCHAIPHYSKHVGLAMCGISRIF
jgi:hypothetical protein